jgi:outer membrane protein assembly factor BamD
LGALKAPHWGNPGPIDLTQRHHLWIVPAVALALAGCSTPRFIDDMFGGKSSSNAVTTVNSDGTVSPDLAAAGEGEPADQLYNKGLTQLKDGSYKSAAKTFGEVERQHPYSQLATKAILMQAFAQYQRNGYDDAINSAQRFITLHPGHKDAPYAYYLIAISNYERIGDVKRSQSMTKKALESLEEVSRRYPGTAYADDAERKAGLARDVLAAKEMEVGRYYTRKGAYLAGINRYKTVVTQYQTTSHTPEALYRLTEGYLALGVQSEAQTAAAVLGHNFPDSDWYKDAYSLLKTGGLSPQEDKSSWISRAVRKLNPF